MAYFPNGTSGEVLDAQCATCPVGADPDAPCPVLLVQLEYNYDQCSKGQEKLKEAMNLLVSEDGECRMKKVMMGAKPTRMSDRDWNDYEQRECVADYDSIEEGVSALNR